MCLKNVGSSVLHHLLLPVLLGAIVSGATLLSAAQEARGQSNLLGERLVEAAATTDFLWILNDQGAVFEFRRSDGNRRLLAKEGVVDLLRSDGQLLGLREVGRESGDYEIVDLTVQTTVSPQLTLNKRPAALLAENGMEILARDALYSLVGGAWQRLVFTEELRSWPAAIAFSPQTGMIYVGYNHGEWGGGMQAVALATGQVIDVSQIDGNELCGGPLNPACDPVTGLIIDRAKPGCTFATVGLAHMLFHGRILRICGTRVEVVFNAKLTRQGLPLKDRGETLPFFDLAETRRGWVAVSNESLIRASGDDYSRMEIPKMEPWHGLAMAEAGPDLIVLSTDLNRRHSLSGYTPLLVPISD